MLTVTPLQRWGVQLCGAGDRHRSTVAGGRLKVTEWSAAAGAEKLLSFGTVLDIGPWGSLSRVHSTVFGALDPLVEERFTQGTIGLLLTGFGRATVRAYYEGPLAYTPPPSLTRSERFASDPALGISLTVAISLRDFAGRK
jgi:hypothetical protein